MELQYDIFKVNRTKLVTIKEMTKFTDDRGCLAGAIERGSVTGRAGVFPMENNTETIAKRARVGRRTPVVFTMKMSLLINKNFIDKCSKE